MTAREFFALLVGAEIRSRFGVPIEKLRWMRDFMLREEANHFRFAFEFMHRFGLTMWLLTDLKKTFILDSVLEFQDMMRWGFFHGDDGDGYIFLNVSPLVIKMAKSLKFPYEITVHDDVWGQVQQSRAEEGSLREKEREVLRLIRNQKYKSVLVHLNNGEICRADAEEVLARPDESSEEKRVLEAIRSQDYQTVTITVVGGKMVHLSRKSPIKL